MTGHQNLRLTNGRFLTLSSHFFLATTSISFTKLKFRHSFWGAESVYILISSKRPKIMTKTTNISLFAFFCICVIKFDSTKIKNHSVPQNDRLNISFVEDIYVVGKKNWLGMAVKRTLRPVAKFFGPVSRCYLMTQ